EGLAGLVGERLFEERDLAERELERHEVARGGAAGADLRREAFEVADVLELVAESVAAARAGDERLDGVEALPDLVHRAERADEPRPEHPPAHRRERGVKDVDERALAAALHRVDELEVALRLGVERDVV